MRKSSLLLMLLVFLWTLPGLAGSSLVDPALESAFLWQFTKFLEVPQAKPDSPFVIGVVENKVLAEAILKTTSGKQVDGRAVEVKEWTWDEALAISDAPQIMIFPTENSPKRSDILHALRNKPCLTVTQNRERMPIGAVINFFADSDNLKFEINRAAATEHGIRVGSQLLIRGKPRF